MAMWEMPRIFGRCGGSCGVAADAAAARAVIRARIENLRCIAVSIELAPSSVTLTADTEEGEFHGRQSERESQLRTVIRRGQEKAPIEHLRISP